MSEHTKTPWKATTGLNVYAMVPAANEDHRVYGVTESKQIAVFTNPQDMLFAIRACNSHEALVAALESALRGAHSLASCGSDEPQLADEVVAQMEAALKLAKP